MTKLETLIQQLCPDGVEYKELSELFDTRNGYTPSKKETAFWENGTIPWFRMEDIRENGQILDHAIQTVSENAVKGNLFPANSIIVATSATIGQHALITVESLANQRFTYLMLKPSYQQQFDIKFIFYYCYLLDRYCLENLNQGNFASVDMKKFHKFKFPVPLLEVQHEIVRILDSYTAHTTELQAQLNAELTARKQQYAYYITNVLSFDKSIEWLPLENFTSTITKGTTPKTFSNSGISFIKTECFDGNYINPEKLSYIDSSTHTGSLKRSILHENDVLFTIAGATIGKCALVPKQLLPANTNQALAIIRPADHLLPKFIFYMLRSSHMSDYIKTCAKGSAQPNINLQQLRDFTVPNISIAEQERIVAILDRFDALCNDLTSGLPAEIEARQKQYEYYRDKLLTFKET